VDGVGGWVGWVGGWGGGVEQVWCGKGALLQGGSRRAEHCLVWLPPRSTHKEKQQLVYEVHVSEHIKAASALLLPTRTHIAVCNPPGPGSVRY
jgi:hypothetical protein